MEKLTHEFTQSLHDNHPPIAWTDTLLQWECDWTQQWNQRCVGEEARVRRMGMCLSVSTSNACLRFPFQHMWAQTGYASVLCKWTFFQQHTVAVVLVQSAALYCRPAAHRVYHEESLKALLSYMTSNMKMKFKCNSKVQVLTRLQYM